MALAALVVAGIAPLGVTDARAEIFEGIHFATTLGELREMFPKAKIEPMHATWPGREEMRAYSLIGEGVPLGFAIVWFSEISSSKFPNVPLEERLTAGAVSWLPKHSIPLSRFVSVYGPPSGSEYDPPAMVPWRRWDKNALAVRLDETESMVECVLYRFTDEEVLSGGEITEKRLARWPAPSTEQAK